MLENPRPELELAYKREYASLYFRMLPQPTQNMAESGSSLPHLEQNRGGSDAGFPTSSSSSHTYVHRKRLYSLLGNLKPAFVALLAFIFLAESITYKNIIGIIVLLLSAYLLESDHHFSDFVKPIKHLLKEKYSIYFILAIFLFSVTAVFDKFIISNYLDIFTYFFLIWLFIAINFNFIHIFLYGYKDTIKCFKKVTYLPVLVGFFSLGGNLLALKALSLAYVSLVTPVLMLNTLFVVVLGGKFFHEKYIYFRLAVSLFMLIGAYLVIT